jgi:hypothetical protein
MNRAGSPFLLFVNGMHSQHTHTKEKFSEFLSLSMATSGV